MLDDTLSITVNGTLRDYRKVDDTRPGVIRRALIENGESECIISSQTKKGIDRTMIKITDSVTDPTTGEVDTCSVHTVITRASLATSNSAEKLMTDGQGYFANTAGLASRIIFGEA